MSVRIDRDGTDKWRYACPRGHTDWTLHDATIACRSCPHWRAPGQVSYGVLIDRKTGAEIEASGVVVE